MRLMPYISSSAMSNVSIFNTMSQTNHYRQVSKKEAKKHNAKLNSLLKEFFAFLDRQPKPTEEEVRTEFRRAETSWKVYCIQNRLDIRTSLLFNAKVSYEWERKYVEKPQ